MNKKKITLCAGLCCVLVVVSLFSSAYNNVTMQVVENKVKNNVPIIVIDAGHGGEDGGASSADGILEKDINLKIAENLKILMEQNGFAVKMIRDSDTALGDLTLAKVKARKVSDLKERLSIYNSDERNIVISIHQNKFSESKYSGTQIFYSTKNEISKLFAESIKKSIVSSIQPDNKRETKPAQSNIFLLYNATVPSVIVECGFLSNAEEAEKLSDAQYQKKIAFSIFWGFLECYYENY